ncbi:MAG: cytochrome c nitrite reductase small subunit [Candidatus Kapaibacterium sp.]
MFIKKLIPPENWRLPVTIILGVLAGIGVTAFHISNASSYLSDDPEACVNCHVMIPHFATWEHSSHREVAVCNDCHVPQDNFVRKYLFKAQDGMRHATVFTLRNEPPAIRILDAGKNVVQENCIRCHINQLHPVSLSDEDWGKEKAGKRTYCWHCHEQVPHGSVTSETSTPFARIPQQNPTIPEWMMKMLNNNENNNK